MEKITSGQRTTIAVTSDFRELYESIKSKGYNFAQVSANAVREAVLSEMTPPARETPKGYVKDEDKEYIGAFVPADIVETLDQLTKPSGSKQAYIREAIKQYAEKHLKLD